MTLREPYNQLLGSYAEHPIMKPYLEGREPDFDGMLNDEHWKSLSTTEQMMWRVAHTFYNNGSMGEKQVELRELGRLDRAHMHRICAALILSRQNMHYGSLKDEWVAWNDYLSTSVDWDAIPEGR